MPTDPNQTQVNQLSGDGEITIFLAHAHAYITEMFLRNGIYVAFGRNVARYQHFVGSNEKR